MHRLAAQVQGASERVAVVLEVVVGGSHGCHGFAIRVGGGIAPFSFSYAGQLPAGLSLNTSTGIISGTPRGILISAMLSGSRSFNL